MLFPVSQWIPDQNRLNNPGDIQALNVIPDVQGYVPFPKMTQAATGSTMGQIYGATVGKDFANNSFVYAGDSSALYRLVGLSFTAATRTAGGAYATDVAEGWEFVQWGQTVIGVNGQDGDKPQEISLGAANFVNLVGGIPAAHIAVINNFVVIGNISDSATNVQRVRWSGINNSHIWSLSSQASTLADFQDLPGDGGWIQKITSGEQGGLIFMEREIHSMVFVGAPLIFQFTKLVSGIGAYAANSVVVFENQVYFLANDGFKSFNGSTITDIGQGKVDRFFLDDLDVQYLGSVRGLLVQDKKIVMWCYPGTGHAGSKCNKIIIYSYAFNKWALVQIPDAFSANIEIISITATPGYTLEGLDAVSTNLDALPFSLDSRAWTGGQLVMAAYVNGTLYYFNGTPMDATVEVTETNLMGRLGATGGRNAVIENKAQMNQLWPLVEGIASLSAVTVAANYRNNTQKELPVMDTLRAPNSAGFASTLLTARYASFIIKTTGEYTQIQGVDVDFVNAGKR